MSDPLPGGDGRPPAVAVCAIDFGWGSAGKLRAIARQLRALVPGTRLVALGTRLGRPVLGELPIEAWYERWPSEPDRLRGVVRRHGIVAALVVLDPSAAIALEGVGCPTVYVDSLPYLWTRHDLLPHDVTVYCAQLCDRVPRAAWQPLSRIRRLIWVNGIMEQAAPERRRPEPGLAVLSVGGLHSPLAASGNDAYLRLVLRPALRALEDAGFGTVEVCGNVGSLDAGTLRESLPRLDLRVGVHSHAEFQTLLDRAQLLVASPGLTTLLEASQRGLPVVCLPPQNLSQILNADRFASAVGTDCCVPWPLHVLDLGDVRAAASAGEEAALAIMYRALEDGARRAAEIGPSLQRGVDQAISNAGRMHRWNGLAAATGTDGARQVAAVLGELLAGSGAVRARPDRREEPTGGRQGPLPAASRAANDQADGKHAKDEASHGEPR